MAIFQKNAERTVNNVVSIPTAAITPNPAQPRVFFDDYSLTQLAVSIQQNGILQPLSVRRKENGYELIAGERRLRAAKLINLEYVPCIIVEVNEANSAVLAILENIQRSDLNFLEESLSIQKLIEYYGLTQEAAAAKLGVAQSTVANKLRLLKLSDKEKSLILRYNLNERQARAVLRLPDEKRESAICDIYIKQLNTTQTDHYIEDLLIEKPKPKMIRKTVPTSYIGLYINSFNKTVEAMKMAGITAESHKKTTDDFIEYTVKIPLR